MNYGRVILGGLVAGLVLNIGEFLLNGVIMCATRWLNGPPTTTSLRSRRRLLWSWPTVLTFVLGIVMVWLYALHPSADWDRDRRRRLSRR